MRKKDFEDKVNELLCVSVDDKYDIKQWHREEMNETVDPLVK